MKVQSNLAASETFFVEEQTRQSLVSFTYYLVILNDYVLLKCSIFYSPFQFFSDFTREIITSTGSGSITRPDE